MIKLFFGLPGSGKTTIAASIALKEVKRRKRKYQNIYVNFYCAIPGITYIDNDCIGKYNLQDALILIDEATLFADSRAFKSFSFEKLQYFLEHRHYNVDIFLFTQQWDGVDRKIRVITDRVYYVYKTLLTGWFRSCYYRIPYGIIIPDPKNKNSQNSEKLGEIIQGYCKPSFLVRLFSTKVYRRKYYKYFDSWERPELDPLPENYQPYPERKKKNKLKELLQNEKSKILLLASRAKDSYRNRKNKNK